MGGKKSISSPKLESGFLVYIFDGDFITIQTRLSAKHLSELGYLKKSTQSIAIFRGICNPGGPQVWIHPRLRRELSAQLPKFYIRRRRLFR